MPVQGRFETEMPALTLRDGSEVLQIPSSGAAMNFMSLT